MRPDKRAVRSEERRRGEKKKKKRRKESKSRMAPCVRLLSFAVMSLAVYSYGAQEDVSRVSDSRKDALHWMRNRTGTQFHGKRRSGPLGVFTTRTKPEPKKKTKTKKKHENNNQSRRRRWHRRTAEKTMERETRKSSKTLSSRGNAIFHLVVVISCQVRRPSWANRIVRDVRSAVG